jgi:hypothetical protein
MKLLVRGAMVAGLSKSIDLDSAQRCVTDSSRLDRQLRNQARGRLVAEISVLPFDRSLDQRLINSFDFGPSCLR